MIVEKFNEYYKNEIDWNKTKIDFIQPIVDKIEKGFKFKFASSSVYCFGKNDVSILLFDQDSHLNIQKEFDKKSKIDTIGGYVIYKINKKLSNPFFNDNNQYLESHFYFQDDEYFKKIKYFISKILKISEELEHYPSIKWDSNRVVEIKISSHKSLILTDKDLMLSNRISEIWYNLL